MYFIHIEGCSHAFNGYEKIKIKFFESQKWNLIRAVPRNSQPESIESKKSNEKHNQNFISQKHLQQSHNSIECFLAMIFPNK